MLDDIETDLDLHGFYRAAYPKRFFAAKPFVVTIIRRAQDKRFFTVLSESDSHYYATVYDPAKVRRLALSVET